MLLLVGLRQPATSCRGFTSYARSDYVQWKKEGRLLNDGVNAKLLGNHGTLSGKKPTLIFETPARVCHVPVHDE